LLRDIDTEEAALDFQEIPLIACTTIWHACGLDQHLRSPRHTSEIGAYDLTCFKAHFDPCFSDPAIRSLGTGAIRNMIEHQEDARPKVWNLLPECSRASFL